MVVRLFKKFPSALVDTAFKILDKTTLLQITPAQLMREAATVRKTQVTLSGKTPKVLAMGRRPRDLMDLASVDPEQLTSTPTNEDSKIRYGNTSRGTTTRRHSMISCWRNEVCSSRARRRRTSVHWQEDLSKIQQGRKSGKLVRVEIIAVKGPKVFVNTGTSISAGKYQ